MASVRVAVRVRPFNERELAHDSKCIIKMEANKTIIFNQNKSASSMFSMMNQSTSIDNCLADVGSNGDTLYQGSNFKEFVYDSSYWSFNSNDEHFIDQTDVYNDLGLTTLNNAFDGYNSCICAYGQTGSGKSFSMMGQTNCSKNEGLIPRICKNLFERIHKNSSSGLTTTSYRVEVSYLEIYNEKVRDLLRLTPEKTQQNLKVREHPKNGVYVEDLSQHIVVNYSDIEELISRGNLNRTTASTNMNDQSSRSHAIFTIKLAQAKLVENNIPSEIISKMNLVDLAGSERADATGATGVRLKEGGNINKSLLTFINVISTLADLSGNNSNGSTKHYIPYRDSVLTWLLKDSLGGNSKTIILAAISPADINYVETLSTLRYANRAKNIINKPTINEDPNVKLIRELRSEIVRLKHLLNAQALNSNLINEVKFHDDSNKNSQSSLDEIKENQIIEKIDEKINSNQNEIDKLTSEWINKWKKCHFILEDFPGISIEKNNSNGLIMYANNQPYLISIEDNSLLQNGINIIPLKEGKTQIGPQPDETEIDNKLDIYIHGNHSCFLQRTNENKVLLNILNGEIQLNDKLLDINDTEGVELKNGDILIIGDVDMFKFFNPLESIELFASSSFSKKNSFKNLIRNYFLNIKKYEFHDAQTNVLNEKIVRYEALIEEQREKIIQMSDEIEVKNSEINKLKEINSKKLPDIESKALDSIEKFERDEKLLNECLHELNKQQENQFKSFIFELQNLKLKEQELELELKRNKTELEKSIEVLCNKRDLKLSRINDLRDEILKNKPMIDLKLKISKQTNDEMELEAQINKIQVDLNNELKNLDSFNKELEMKKYYCYNDRQTLNEACEAENRTIERNRAQLEQTKKQKLQEYALIEKELEVARKQMIEQFEANNLDLVKAKREKEEISSQVTKLKAIMENSLYENDEEKCLVENELSDLNLKRENLEKSISNIQLVYLNELNNKMNIEYKCLNDLKTQDLDEIKQDEERISLLEENSIQFLLKKIDTHKKSILENEKKLKGLEGITKINNKKMNELLNELEVLENNRLVEETKVFNQEMQVANEFKIELENLNAQLRKLDMSYRIKLDENFSKKESLKPKLFSLVGKNKGSQLFDADFNPKISQYLQHKREQKQLHLLELDEKIKFEQETFQKNPRTITSPSDSETLKDIYVDTSVSNNDSGINSTSSTGVSPINDFGTQHFYQNIFQLENLKFQTSSCKALGISIEINKSYLIGKKTWDEHYEYEIEIKINDEYWKIFRRFNKIRQLHEKMCKLYPSLNCLVFPMRYFPNLMIRQIQLEHYLKCFIEILINDSTSPIYINLYERMLSPSNSSFHSDTFVSNSTSLNSIIYSSNSSIIQESINYLTKVKLCTFCSFFQETENDLKFMNQTNTNNLSNSIKNILLNSKHDKKIDPLY